MRRLLSNCISVIISFIKFSFIKVFNFKNFNFYLIERFSPNVRVTVGKNSRLHLGKRIRVHSGSKIISTAGGYLNIEDDSKFNYNCMIVCRHNIHIKKGVEVGPNVLIYDHDHNFRAKGGIKAKEYKNSPVVIGENCWIGANTVILRGTVIGDNCVIGAGSVVRGSIPANTIMVQRRENDFIPIDNEDVANVDR